LECKHSITNYNHYDWKLRTTTGTTSAVLQLYNRMCSFFYCNPFRRRRCFRLPPLHPSPFRPFLAASSLGRFTRCLLVFFGSHCTTLRRNNNKTTKTPAKGQRHRHFLHSTHTHTHTVMPNSFSLLHTHMRFKGASETVARLLFHS